MNSLTMKNQSRGISELQMDGTIFKGTALADKFNQHFLVSGAASTTNAATDPELYIKMSILNSIYLSPVSESEVCNILKALKNSKACGEDKIKAEPIKAVAHFLCQPLSHVCNLIISTGFSRQTKNCQSFCYIKKRRFK